ncbi:hypothetical protein Q8A67_008541 [Cirrhinus molitorella]|uniref:Uncharacterized protein n=1 Tax=Cirrhinus molitorella TaxID=172907 RepID=A0AA88TSH2_9TELE|nr:hypothetical protein Q8A67_008541 [Cirrhinus molitorella]
MIDTRYSQSKRALSLEGRRNTQVHLRNTRDCALHKIPLQRTANRSHYLLVCPRDVLRTTSVYICILNPLPDQP